MRYLALLVVLSLMTGCVTLPTLIKSEPPPKPEPTPVAASKPVPKVHADIISEANAWEMVESLREEMDREAQGEPVQKPAKLELGVLPKGSSS